MSGAPTDRWLRIVLRALPAEFRAEYADEILAFHNDRLRDVGRSPWAALRIRVGAVRDVLWHAAAERSNDARRALANGGSSPPHDRQVGTNRTHVGEAVMNVVREFRYAVRGLAKTPGFALAFVLTIGLGIGANTAIFSVVRGVLLRPLPHDGGDRVVYLRQTHAVSAIPNVTFSVPEIRDYREASSTLSAVAEFSALTFTMLSNGEPRRIRSGIVSGNYFDVMGLETVLGRTFTDADDPESADPVMIVTHDFWLRSFGGDSSVLGQTVRMNGRTIEIVGVLEQVPDYPERTDVLVNTVASPHHMGAAMGFDRDHRMTQVFARLAPGHSTETAKVELDGIAARLHQENPEVYVEGAPIGVAVSTLKEEMTRNARLTLLILIGAAGFVLVIACANVANLTLTRSIRRQRELSVRAVLGAERGTLRRLLLIENAVVTFGGAALGLILAVAGMDLLVSYASRFTPRATEITVDGWVLTFTVVVAGGAALLFAFVPKLPQAGKLSGAVASASLRTTGGLAGRRLQRGLVVTQLAVSFVLLIGAGLLLRTLVNLERVDPGFDVENVLTLDVPARSAGRTSDEVISYYETMRERISTLPGVVTAAVSSVVPLATDPFLFEISVEGYQPDVDAPAPQADFRSVSPDYFAAVGTPLLGGRTFQRTDHADAAKVVMINQSMAEQFFPGQSAVGRRVRWSDAQMRFLGVDTGWRTVVGVIADARDLALDEAPLNAVYQPMAQEVWAGSLLIRTANSPQALTQSVVKIIRDLDAEQPIENIQTLAQLRAGATAPKRLNATLVGLFALLALLIAAVGVAGVLAFSVSQRTHEIGVRLSLGANEARVRRMVLREGGVLLVAGLVVGGAVAFGVSRFLSGLLFEVQATDPATYVGVGLTLALVSLGSSWVPAWRASRVEPVTALRSD
jgi:predicted permease